MFITRRLDPYWLEWERNATRKNNSGQKVYVISRELRNVVAHQRPNDHNNTQELATCTVVKHTLVRLVISFASNFTSNFVSCVEFCVKIFRWILKHVIGYCVTARFVDRIVVFMRVSQLTVSAWHDIAVRKQDAESRSKTKDTRSQNVGKDTSSIFTGMSKQ